MKRKRALVAAEKLEKAKKNPKDLFINQTDKYSAFDENGIPTLDKEGKELSKVHHIHLYYQGASKKVKKEWDTQKANYEKYLES